MFWMIIGALVFYFFILPLLIVAGVQVLLFVFYLLGFGEPEILRKKWKKR